MPKRILIRPKASIDLDQQFSYIAERNFDVALSFFDAARQSFSQLAKFPSIGRICKLTNSRLFGTTIWIEAVGS